MPATHGAPRPAAIIKQNVGDFVVIERPNWSPSGAGEHDVLWIEKVGANTAWVAGALARHAGVQRGAVSFAGRKDRHAVTRQWFSVHLPGRSVDWTDLSAEGVTVLDVQRHHRKLRTGSLAGNRFELRVPLQGGSVDPQRLDGLSDGVPNYFGPQRFGNAGANLMAAETFADGGRLGRNARSMAVSAARSGVFNRILATRVQARTWSQPMAGDVVMLDGTRSLFGAVVTELADLRRRASEGDLHPTGWLCGDGDIGSREDIAVLERTIAAQTPAWLGAARRARAQAERRALRVAPTDLQWHLQPDALQLAFDLPAGAFATALLNELVVLADQ